jgi:hypothetical protein
MCHPYACHGREHDTGTTYRTVSNTRSVLQSLYQQLSEQVPLLFTTLTQIAKVDSGCRSLSEYPPLHAVHANGFVWNHTRNATAVDQDWQ